MSYIHNPFAELPSNEEDIESMQSAASDVEFFLRNAEITTALDNLRIIIEGETGAMADILSESTDHDGETIESLLYKVRMLYVQIVAETTAAIQGHEEWIKDAQDDKKEAADLRADYLASVL